MTTTASLSQRIATVIAEAGKFATGDAAECLARFSANLDDLAAVGVVEGADPEPVVFGSALEVAQYAERLHLDLLLAEENDEISGSEADCSLGNFVFCLCISNGVDLENDDGYCNKATQPEICSYNLERLAAALAEKDK